MAVGTFTLYDSAKLAILNGTIDLDTDNITAILVDETYTPSASTHTAYSDVSTYENADGDYAPVQLTTKAVTEAGGTVKFDSDDVDYGASVTITTKYIVLVHNPDTSLAAGDALIGYMDLDTTSGSATVSSSSAQFTVGPNASNGWFTVA